MSLSPLPDTVSTTMSEGWNFTFSSAPKAWADSSAGMMPSSRVSSKAARSASSSLTANAVALFCAAKLACMGPMPG